MEFGMFSVVKNYNRKIVDKIQRVFFEKVVKSF